jgi:hypothetical protein
VVCHDHMGLKGTRASAGLALLCTSFSFIYIAGNIRFVECYIQMCPGFRGTYSAWIRSHFDSSILATARTGRGRGIVRWVFASLAESGECLHPGTAPCRFRSPLHLSRTGRPEVGQPSGLEDSLEPPPGGFKQPPGLEDILEPPGLELPWGFRQLVCLEDLLELPPFGGFRQPPGLEDLELSPVPCSGFRADVDAFMPSLLGAQAASAAGRKAAALEALCHSGSEQAARILEEELETMVSALNKNYMKDGVERALARAIEDCRNLGFNEVETPLYDAFMAACCRHIDIAAEPIDPAHPAFRDHRITQAHPLGKMIVAAFARDFGPGSGQDLEDLTLWSRILGARFHVYRHPGQPIETSRSGRRRRTRRGERPRRPIEDDLHLNQCR